MDPRTIQLSASTIIVTRFMLAVLVAGAAFLVFARESNACIFPTMRSQTEEFRQSSIVFAGKVIAASSVPDGRIYKLKIHTVWKGPLHEEVFIFRNVGVYAKGTTCETSWRQFIVEEEYLVYDDIGVGRRTQLLFNANEDLAALGEGQRPVSGSSAPVPPDVSEARARQTLRQVAVGIVVALTATAVGALVMQIRAVRRRNELS